MTRLSTNISALMLSIALGLLWVISAAAQEIPTPDYELWDERAEVAQTVLEDPPGPAALTAIRKELVDWREEFQAAQGINAARIETVKDQLAALGPAPAEGETEAEDITLRRTELTRQLNELLAPSVAATEAYTRADALITNTSEALRTRQADALVERSPTPLNPMNWALAFSDVRVLLRNLGSELVRGIDGDGFLGLGNGAGAIVGYLALALFLITIGRGWISRLPEKLPEWTTEVGRVAAGFGASLARIVLPLAGLALAIVAVRETGWLGQWSRPFVEAIPVAGSILFVAIWIARQSFPTGLASTGILPLPERPRQTVRRALISMASVYAIYRVIGQAWLPTPGTLGVTPETLSVPVNVTPASAAVLYTLMIAAGAVLIYTAGLRLRRAPRHDPEDPASLASRIVGWAGNLLRVVAVASLVLALIGYVTLANSILWPSWQSLNLILLIMLLQSFCADLLHAVKIGPDDDRDSLWATLIGFGLSVASIPLFLLIWGVPVPELLEYWTKIRHGVNLGGVTLSPGTVLTFLVMFAIGYGLTRVVQGTFRNTILPKTKLDQGAQSAAISGLGYVGIFFAAMLAITSAGIDLSSIALVAGALSVGIGFGLQTIVSNFVSGIILLIERPVTVGDWIDTGGNVGIVKRISVRATRIQTFDKTDIIVPNSDLISQPVTNWTRGNLTGRVIVSISVAYGSDTRAVEAILREVAEDQPVVLIDPAPQILFQGFGADGLDFEVRVILADVTLGLGIASEMRHTIYQRLNEAGIEIPFAQRDLWLRNPEALARAFGHQAASSDPEEAVPHIPIAPAPARVQDAPQDSDGDAGGDR